MIRTVTYPDILQNYGPIAMSSGLPAFTVVRGCRQGTIRTLRVIQLDGDLEGFQFALYNSTRAFLDAHHLAPDADLYRVTPTYTVAPAANGAAAAGEGLYFAFSNIDGTVTSPDDRLWLWIDPGGLGVDGDSELGSSAPPVTDRSFGLQLVVEVGDLYVD